MDDAENAGVPVDLENGGDGGVVAITIEMEPCPADQGFSVSARAPRRDGGSTTTCCDLRLSYLQDCNTPCVNLQKKK
jgi:hypothetical protein